MLSDDAHGAFILIVGSRSNKFTSPWAWDDRTPSDGEKYPAEVMQELKKFGLVENLKYIPENLRAYTNSPDHCWRLTQKGINAALLL
jgi:hypothetical protein